MKTEQYPKLAFIIGMFICWLVPNIIWASVEVDGIYYDLNASAKTAAVASNPEKYTGAVDIPSSFVYNGSTYNATSIGDHAFDGCTGLTSVAIPNSVTSIGTSAFAGCTGLTSMEIPNSVISIGTSAFAGCTGLTSMEIPNSVIRIDSDAFYNCSGLTSLVIPNSVTSIRTGAFQGCTGLTSISVDSNNSTYDSRGNCNAIMETSTNTLILGCKNTVIPNSVTSIGGSAFYGCRGLASVAVPNSVTSIGGLAFYGCTDLTSVTVPNSVTEIGADAFSGTAWYNNQQDGLIYINQVAYKYKGVMPVGTEITINNGTVSISGSAFYGCTGLTSVTIPNRVKSIGSSAFYGCTGLTSMTIPNSVTSIGNLAFERCSGLTSVTIPNSVKSIGFGAFISCTGLTSVTIPNSLTSIGNNVFAGCTGLTSITVEKEIPLTINDNMLFYNVDKTNCTLYVPYGSKSAYQNAAIWSEFENIVEPSAIETGSCGSNVNYSICSDMTLVISGTGEMEDYSYYTHINQNYYESIKRVIIEDGVTSIGRYAFSGCTGLTSVDIPNSVTRIGENAFSGCTGLTTITMESETPISIDISTFSNVDKANCTLYVPYGCKSAYEAADYWNEFENIVTSVIATGSCSSGVTYTIYSDMTMVISGTGVMGRSFWKNYFRAVKKVIIEDGVTSFGSREVFDDFTSMTSIFFPSTMEGFGLFPFRGCTALNSIIVDSNNPKFDSRDNCNAIIETASNTLWWGCKNTTIPNSITSIGSYAFSDCIGLTSIEIPNSITSIGSGAFYGCTGLTSVTIPSSVTSIGSYAFRGCTGLTAITVEMETPLTIDSYVFNKVDKSNCTLYVPYGSKPAYENAAVWSEFQNIVELDSDISTLDNAIYVEQTEGRIGGTKDITVKMKNNFDVRGFQFTMELPEGATIHSWTLNQGRMPAGTTMNKVFATEGIDENVINVVCALNDGQKTFTGNDGVIATVNVTFAEDMEEGTYPIRLTNNSISDATAEYQLELSDIKSTLVLEDYVVGDTNGDGKVLVGDVIAILNYIVGSPSSNFNTKAADVNGDGKILVGDVIAVLNIIVNQ